MDGVDRSDINMNEGVATGMTDREVSPDEAGTAENDSIEAQRLDEGQHALTRRCENAEAMISHKSIEVTNVDEECSP